MSNESSANGPNRKRKESTSSSTDADCNFPGESQGDEYSNLESEDRPSEAPAASVTGPDLKYVPQTPRDRTFSFKDTIDDGTEEYAEADELNEPPDDEEGRPLESPRPNLLPRQILPYKPESEGYAQVDHNAPEFDGTEEADAYWCNDANEHDDEADDKEVKASDGDHSAPKVTVPRLMHYLREMGGVWVSCFTRPITDNGDQAILLSQILYWFDDGKRQVSRARVFKNNRRWFYKTHEEFAEETGIPPRRVKDCLHALRDKGYIDIEYFLAEGSRTTHIAVNVETVFKAMYEPVLRRKNAGRTKSVPR